MWTCGTQRLSKSHVKICRATRNRVFCAQALNSLLVAKDGNTKESKETHDREAQDVVSEEVVIQAGQPVRATGKELNFGLDLQNKRVAGLDGSQNLLDALLQLTQALPFQLLNDRIGSIDGDSGGDVMEGDGRIELVNARSRKKPGVYLLKRHLRIVIM